MTAGSRPRAAEGAGPLRRPAGENAPADRLGLLERAFLIFALFGQQGAFFNVVRVYQGRDAADQVGVVFDPLNMASVAITFAGVLFLLARRQELVARIAAQSHLVLLLCLFAALSGAWSDSLGLTIKRAGVHLNSVLLALYIAARLDFAKALALVAQSIAISAGASLFAGLFLRPVGIMHSIGLEGRWRGVFPHKNPFSQAMAIGAILELYGLDRGPRRLGHVLMFLLEVGLVVLANSATVLILLVFAGAAYLAHAVSRPKGLIGRAFWIATPLVLGTAVVTALIDPSLVKLVSGRDASLTGRAQLWRGVEHAISLRPLLGYGYQAFWDSADPLAVEIWNEIGWNAPNAHNSFLEVLLGLGAAGAFLAILVVAQGLIRSLRLFIRALDPLAPAAAFRAEAFCAGVLIIAILIESLTEAVLLRQGDIDWMMLNLLSLAAALALKRAAPAVRAPSRDIAARARPLRPDAQAQILR